MTSRNINYHLKQTWEQKYRANNCQKYEWIDSSNQAFEQIRQYLPHYKQIKILQLGCGSSSLCQIMYRDGYQNITCVDFSKRIIKSRTQRNKQIKFINAEFTEPFKFDAQIQYDIIIDKGSIDCIFCDQNYLKKVLVCIGQCYDRLKQGGRLLSFSLGLPKNRKFWFRNKLTPFQIQVKKLKNNFRQNMRKNVANYNKDKAQNSEQYFLYICTKGANQHPKSQRQNMPGVNFQDQAEQEEQKLEQDEHDQNADNQPQKSDQQDQSQKQRDEQQQQKQEQEDAGEQGQNSQNSSKEQQQQQQQQQQQEQNYQDQHDQN